MNDLNKRERELSRLRAERSAARRVARAEQLRKQRRALLVACGFFSVVLVTLVVLYATGALHSQRLGYCYYN